jgi:multicomponent Na+:H+ antiporter subunit E
MATGFIILKRFVMFLALWLVLSGGAISGLPFGIVTAAVAAWTSLRLLPADGRRIRLHSAVLMLPGFLWRSIRGGVDVAWRAFHPKLPVAPGWLLWRTRLPEGGPRVTLGSELSLLPGTLVAGSRGDVLYVHCLDTTKDVAGEMAAEEARIASMIEGEPS